MEIHSCSIFKRQFWGAYLEATDLLSNVVKRFRLESTCMCVTCSLGYVPDTIMWVAKPSYYPKLVKKKKKKPLPLAISSMSAAVKRKQ